MVTEGRVPYDSLAERGATVFHEIGPVLRAQSFTHRNDDVLPPTLWVFLVAQFAHVPTIVLTAGRSDFGIRGDRHPLRGVEALPVRPVRVAKRSVISVNFGSQAPARQI